MDSVQNYDSYNNTISPQAYRSYATFLVNVLFVRAESKNASHPARFYPLYFRSLSLSLSLSFFHSPSMSLANDECCNTRPTMAWIGQYVRGKESAWHLLLKKVGTFFTKQAPV
jgi:hypothetical protein